ncbi:magnesium and cobalt transport protein CorA [Pseudomonas sp. JS3066]|jgi:magnesium transporter|uniref:magnesium and cobalt transport protein CorA n=1 Tax=unclassified Pseudomonas TaxID=196821 RepID=UPI000EAA1634|nr:MULTISPECIES: magnesium and cobalt transport protein CorA [unclassified Pseudomonas]AYF87215.1 magnesium and cobalt transport protein CorA [Pseudomonas sp. DY-1]MDH4651424.1 magnesium and cobalt transport protein CorA [Pseudomonas sp. BN606]MRK23274.1 magnesium and cobalt transport protein CorA [Pseudomonas sp. JG-B]WVK95243.1 magnesium and cobalt transport protein CorA [Pseudomonas sp. JS3066]
MGRVVAAAVYAKGRKVTDITLDEGLQWASKPGHFVWIGLHDPGAEELSNLQRQFDLHELALEDALTRHTRPKLETFGDALFLVVYSPIEVEGELQFIETQLFAGKGYIISARYGESAPYSRVRQRCEARPLLLEHGEDFVLYALLSFVMENYRPLMDSFHSELEEIEQAVLERPLGKADVERIHCLRRDLLRLRRYIGPMGEICEELQRLDFPFIDKQMRPYFRDIAIHVNRLLEDLTGLREMADHAIEIGLLLESSRQSVVQRKFAAWAAILAFPTAIAGIYGMNFQYMPELNWHYGYFGVLGVVATGCTGLYASFKYYGWL